MPFIKSVTIGRDNISHLHFLYNIPSPFVLCLFIYLIFLLPIDRRHLTGDKILLGRVQIDFKGNRLHPVRCRVKILLLTLETFFQQGKEFPAK